MPDEPQVVRGIDWKSTFPFTLIFKSFRIAIHPSKLVLALVALVLIYVGGRFLDAVWPADWLAVPDELTLYIDSRNEQDPSKTFSERRQRARKQILDDFKAELNRIGKPGGDLADIKADLLKQRDQDVKRAQEDFDPAKQTSPEDKARVQKERDRAIQAAYARASLRWNSIRTVKGVGLFKTLWEHQMGMIHQIVNPDRLDRRFGQANICQRIWAFFTVGPGWAIRHHPLYFTIFGIWFLIVWAIFGGAISRIAAVQVARDERIAFRQALGFSTAKFLSFVSAPIIPLLIILFVGLVVSVGGLIFNIPLIGPIVAGALYFLALGAGFVMTLVLLGLLGGFNLMYPTIAVEGSDSFDAISRSFSYLYARPWRLLLYTVIAAIYGGICYLFVRFFLLIMLWLTHSFTGLLIFRQADNAAPLWPTLWPNPLTAGHLTYSIDFLTLSGGQDAGAVLVAFWVYLAIALLGAFAISFYFSANTVVYMLMRHEVDATELDDVYMEQTEEDLSQTAQSAETGSEAGAAVEATSATATTPAAGSDPSSSQQSMQNNP